MDFSPYGGWGEVCVVDEVGTRARFHGVDQGPRERISDTPKPMLLSIQCFMKTGSGWSSYSPAGGARGWDGREDENRPGFPPGANATDAGEAFFS